MFFSRTLQSANSSGTSSQTSSGCIGGQGTFGINLECIGIGLFILLFCGLVIWLLAKLYKYLKESQLLSLKNSISSLKIKGKSTPKVESQNLPSSVRGAVDLNKVENQRLDTSATYQAELSNFPDEGEPIIFVTLTRTVFDHYVKQKVFGADFTDKFHTKL
jgi:hypothetical protein